MSLQSSACSCFQNTGTKGHYVQPNTALFPRKAVFQPLICLQNCSSGLSENLWPASSGVSAPWTSQCWVVVTLIMSHKVPFVPAAYPTGLREQGRDSVLRSCARKERCPGMSLPANFSRPPHMHLPHINRNGDGDLHPKSVDKFNHYPPALTATSPSITCLVTVTISSSSITDLYFFILNTDHLPVCIPKTG